MADEDPRIDSREVQAVLWLVVATALAVKTADVEWAEKQADSLMIGFRERLKPKDQG